MKEILFFWLLYKTKKAYALFAFQRDFIEIHNAEKSVLEIEKFSKLQWLEHRLHVCHGWLELVFIFEYLKISSGISRNISGKSSYFIMTLNVMCTYYNSLIDVILMNALIILLFYRTYNQLFFSPDLALWLTLGSVNHPCLEQISKVPRIFEQLKFDCI